MFVGVVVVVVVVVFVLVGIGTDDRLHSNHLRRCLVDVATTIGRPKRRAVAIWRGKWGELLYCLPY